MRKYDSVLDLMKESTIVRIPPRAVARRGASLWAQLELQLPGAMKDRVGLKLIEDAERSGILRPGDIIVESSSGSMAEALARVGAAKHYRVIIVTDPRLDEITKAKLLALGAELEIIDTYDTATGWQGARLRRVSQIIEKYPHAFWACQYDSPGNPAAYESVGQSLFQALGTEIAALVGTVGTGGSLCGTGRALRRYIPDLKIVAVDAVGSVIFNQPNRKRLQSGHGNSMLPGNVDYRAIDQVHWISDGEAFNGCHELARHAGIFAGGSSGAAYIAGSWVAEQFPGDQNVVVIFPDRGDRYYSTIYSPEFMRDHDLDTEIAGLDPIPIRYGQDVATRWSCAQMPREDDGVGHPWATTTLAFAGELGLEGAYT